MSNHKQQLQLRDAPVVPIAKDLPDGVALPRAPTLRASLAASRATSLVIALTIFGVFLPVVIVRYAFSDDYPLLFIADRLGSSPWFGNDIANTVAASGRPLAGVLDEFFFSAAGTIDNLRLIRLV